MEDVATFYLISVVYKEGARGGAAG
jgi:hypothetical protein